MVKRITQIMALVLVLGCAAAFAAEIANTNLSINREKVAQRRANRTAKATPAKPVATSLREVKGGANGDKPLYGIIANTTDWGPFTDWYGAVEISADGAHTKLKEFDHQPLSGCYFNGSYLSVSYPFNGDAVKDVLTYTFYDSEWNVKSRVNYTTNSKNTCPYSMTYDPTTGTVYCCVFENTGYWGGTVDEPNQFGRINFDDAGAPVFVINSNLPTHMRALAADKDGNITGIGTDGMLYNINKFTGEATATVKIKNLPGEDPWAEWYEPISQTYGNECAVYDWETGYIYFAYSEAAYWDTFIARIDPATGNAELVAALGYDGAENYDVFTGMFFKQQASSEGSSPAAATDLIAEPVGINLQAKVTFTAPDKDTSGGALNGNLQWRISDGTNDLATGTTTPSATVTETVNVAQRGLTNFVVYISQNDNESAPVFKNIFVGPDTPVMFGIPNVRTNGKRVTLSWNLPYAENSGNLGDITYKITRMPDDVVVAEAATGQSFVDEIAYEYLTKYTYDVQPVAAGIAGKAVTSRAAYIGDYFGFPWNDSFTDGNLFLKYPVIDANDDGNTWDINTNNGSAYYTTNGQNADDYLLVGPFKMEAGNTYTFRMTAEAPTYRELFSVCVGNDPKNASSFKTEILTDPDLGPSTGMRQFSSIYVPEADGNYYFAIHVTSTGYARTLYVYDISVAAADKKAPAAPEVEVIPELTTATFKITVPNKALDGSAVGNVSMIKISRDGQEIGTISEGLTPGAVVEFVDRATVSRGKHPYEITAVNAIGDGKPTQLSVYRGLDVPGTPRNLRIWEDLNQSGVMHVTFDHPERGYNGGYINPSDIIYSIDYLIMGIAAGDVELGTGTNHTFKISGDITKQDVFAGSVYGKNSAGSIKTSWSTAVATFGPALPLPIHESWTGQGVTSGVWTSQIVVSGDATSNSHWSINAGTDTKIKPNDGDAGMILFSGNVENSRRRYLSPRFTIEGNSNPTLVFYYNYNEHLTKFEVQVYEDDKTIATLQDMDISPANRGKWVRASIPLKQFAGCKYLQLGFTAYGGIAEEIMAIDNVTISDLRAHNLSVVDYACPSKINVNEIGTFVASIRNNGTDTAPANSYKVHLYKNGKIICSTNGIELAPDNEAMAVLRDTPTVADPASSTYYMAVEYTPDQNVADNESIRKAVRIVTPDYPTVTDLTAQPINGVTLSWSDPSTANMPGTPTTESFETYEDFTISDMGDWSLFDGDEKPTVVMAQATGMVEFPNVGQPMAWIVFDPEKANVFGSAWYARTGKKMLVSFQACVNNSRLTESEDWLISPELNGSRQQISFYGRTGMKGYSPESFDFMISSTGNQPSDFTALAKDQLMGFDDTQWPEYVFTVPEGTRYFAIVHKSYNKFAMLIDDITYIPAGSSPLSLDLMGFNVYRDGKRLNTEPVVENEYVDTTVEAKKQYTYHVSTVWDQGEAPLSNPVTIEVTSGISNVVTSTLLIAPLQGAIRVEGGEGQLVEVFTTTGMRVATVTVNGTVEIPVGDAGVYIVKAGNTAEKVAVR